MARKKSYQDLYVFMNGMLVGTLVRETSGNLSFTYHVDWLTWAHTRPISLSMPLTEMPYKGLVVNAYFDNLLPDSDLIRKRIQARFRVNSDHCFDLLAQIGADCIGALQLLPHKNISQIQTIDHTPIEDAAIANLLKQYKTAPLGMAQDIDFRISIAGAQEKTALLWHASQWCLPHGTTPTSHIIKLPIGQIKPADIDLSDSVENEWLCLQILSAYNLPVNHARILYFDKVKTLTIERFDRRWAENKKWLMRLPQEDLCQALGVSPALKYESDGGPDIQAIMRVLLGSKDAMLDREKFMKTIFLFWVMAAIDGHAKNFSLTLEAQGRYKLTPLYDVMSAYPLTAKHQLDLKKIKMAMSLKSKKRYYLWSDIQLKHWLLMAQQCQFAPQRMQEIIEEVLDTMESVISQVQKKLPAKFPSQMQHAIFAGMRHAKDSLSTSR